MFQQSYAKNAKNACKLQGKHIKGSWDEHVNQSLRHKMTATIIIEKLSTKLSNECSVRSMD